MLAMIASLVACVLFTVIDRLGVSRAIRVETCISWVVLFGILVWRVQLQDWKTDLYLVGAAVYWSLLLWTGFRPFMVAPRLWSDEHRTRRGLLKRARIAQYGFFGTLFAIGAWAVSMVVG